MRSWLHCISVLLTICLLQSGPAHAQGFANANTQKIPGRILPSGTDLSQETLSANAQQLAEQIGIIPIFQKMRDLKTKLQSLPIDSADSLLTRVQLLEEKEKAVENIQKVRLEVDFALAEITDEQNIYHELLLAFTASSAKKIAIANMIGFGTNGALWAIGEALDIPTYKNPRLSIPSGTVGILAGIIPSMASAYALREVNGAHYSAPAEPNMLAKLFDRPTNPSIEYPENVWTFLNTVPADEPASPNRRDQIVNRWVADKNLPQFTNPQSAKQIDIVTASEPQHRTLTISVVNQRLAMLQQLSGEILKMDRLLLELMLVVTGEKHL